MRLRYRQGGLTLSGATRQPRDRARSNAHGIWTPRSGVRLSVVIPTMNEAESIGWVLERLPTEAAVLAARSGQL